MKPRTIAIGDIHGCAVALAALLKAIGPRSDDTIVTLGDYVDRGPDSRGVIEQLVALVDQCHLVPLIGNHELMMLESVSNREALEFWKACGGAATFASYGDSFENVPADHWTFLRGLRPHFENERCLFVHANYEPDLSLEQTSHDVLFWKHVGPSIPPRHFSGKKVIVGHTPQANGCILDFGHLVCIDTYCFGGEWLTALDAGTGEFWQANEDGMLRYG